jgi:hypothetical protein
MLKCPCEPLGTLSFKPFRCAFPLLGSPIVKEYLQPSAVHRHSSRAI